MFSSLEQSSGSIEERGDMRNGLASNSLKSIWEFGVSILREAFNSAKGQKILQSIIEDILFEI